MKLSSRLGRRARAGFGAFFCRDRSSRSDLINIVEGSIRWRSSTESTREMLRDLRKRFRRKTVSILDRHNIGRSRRLEALVRGGDWAAIAALPAEGLSWRDRWKDLETIDFAQRIVARGAPSRQVIALREHHLFGRAQEFHHFMGAVVLPFLDMISIGVFSKQDLIALPDCGFLNKIVSDICEKFGFELEFYPYFMQDWIADGVGIRLIDLPPHDHSSQPPYFLTAEQLAAVRRVAFRFADMDEWDDAEVGAGETRLLLIERAPPDPYYLSEKHRNPVSAEGHSGSGRRSIANAAELRTALSQRFDVNVVKLEHMNFREQIRAFHEAAMIVAQHGAGLNGVLWGRRGGGVVEIIPTVKLRNEFTIFRNFSSAVGLRHRHVVQASGHGPVDIDLVLASLDSVSPASRAAAKAGASALGGRLASP